MIGKPKHLVKQVFKKVVMPLFVWPIRRGPLNIVTLMTAAGLLTCSFRSRLPGPRGPVAKSANREFQELTAAGTVAGFHGIPF